MAVARIGDVASFSNANNTGTQEIAIPGDAELCVVGLTGWVGTTYPFSTGGVLSLESTTMTPVSGTADASVSALMSCLWYVLVPSGWRGANGTLDWNWAGTADLTNGGTFQYAFYKGIDLSVPVRDSDGAQAIGSSGVYVTPSLTKQTGDLVVGVSANYSASNTTVIWTNASEVRTEGVPTSRSSWAEGLPSGDGTITATWSSGDDGSVCAIVLKPAAGGASSISVADARIVTEITW